MKDFIVSLVAFGRSSVFEVSANSPRDVELYVSKRLYRGGWPIDTKCAIYQHGRIELSKDGEVKPRPPKKLIKEWTQ